MSSRWKTLLALGASTAMLLPLTASVATATSSAVPASTVEWGNCTATFVRSASGIVNETDRECDDAQNGWVDADVYLQFRPLQGRPNPACDAEVHSQL